MKMVDGDKAMASVIYSLVPTWYPIGFETPRLHFEIKFCRRDNPSQKGYRELSFLSIPLILATKALK